ncbi:MAG: BrnT family toxin [Rhodomicrobium sp.]
MNENDFEWDEEKAAANFRKHRITFKVARYVFDDRAAIDEPDGREDYGEARFNIIGMVRDHLFFVTYTIRKSKFRLISARRAVPHEKRRYHEKNR